MTTLITGQSGERFRRSGPAIRSATGFTLLELVLVMVIICTVLAMASLSLRGFFSSRRTADAAAQIVALTQFARTSAVTDGKVYRVNLDVTEGKYWLTAQAAGAFETIPSEFGRVFLLPEGTTAQWVEPLDAELLDWIPFYPDSRTEAAHIRLTGRQGETADIVCASPAELFRVVAYGAGEPL